MTPQVRRAILFCSFLWLGAGFVAGWFAAEMRRNLAEPRERGSASLETEAKARVEISREGASSEDETA